MLKKRLIGVITVKAGVAVQSFGYSRYLPLGSPECLAENLDRWGVDEILVLCIDRSRSGHGPDLALLRRLGALGLSTPLSYGGGVHTVAEAAQAIQAGAERLCLDAVLHADPGAVRDMAALLGSQALVAALPMAMRNGEAWHYAYLQGSLLRHTEETNRLFDDGTVSEALLIDAVHEGQRNAFDAELVRRFPRPATPLIVFGGISEPAQIGTLLAQSEVVAVAVGNSLNYSEHAVQNLKQQVQSPSLRPAIYMGGR
ncbi:MAG: HisA/HisF-related TIM barrel protein [Burkholderiaceae bacterium]|uniref:HisA/HisF-related TIM barrel protein n=1 Tax=Polaromonas sp. YR568 TaxID=1855301 RepID=UPI00271E719F|nr:HisA/HisF-related TIM barrel protein [Burkholderiaceae bacterium]MDO9316898.1 HisA/HisF-related TIM barrel protein [Gammaproteobacteria bacterium]